MTKKTPKLFILTASFLQNMVPAAAEGIYLSNKCFLTDLFYTSYLGPAYTRICS